MRSDTLKQFFLFSIESLVCIDSQSENNVNQEHRQTGLRAHARTSYVNA